MRHTVRDLSDDQWKVLNRLIPKPKRRSDGRGRLASGAETIAEDIFIKAVWSEATELKLSQQHFTKENSTEWRPAAHNWQQLGR
jgi:hypothetical protein